jgi:hypothetical protein
MKVLHPHPKKPMPWLTGTDWPEFWRVRLPDTRFETEKAQWCANNVETGQWAKNFGGEVFYFRRIEDATAFKMRWEGANEASPSA